MNNFSKPEPLFWDERFIIEHFDAENDYIELTDLNNGIC